MKINVGFAIPAVVTLIAAGCGDDTSSPQERGRPGCTFLDDPIVLEVSEPVQGTQVEPEEYVFDVSEVPLFRDGSFNDFEVIYYKNPICGAEAAWVLDPRSDSWEQIVFPPPAGVICVGNDDSREHLFSARGLDPARCATKSGLIRLRVLEGSASKMPELRVLRINPKYHAIPVISSERRACTGVAFDGKSLWVSSFTTDKLYEFSTYGNLRREVEVSTDYIFDLTFDGKNLWFLGGGDRLGNITREGDVLCSFSGPSYGLRGLAWAGDMLWLSRNLYGSRLVFVIDPGGSCNGGTAAIADTLYASSDLYGLAWDGTHVLGVDDHVYKLSSNGEVLKTYDLPVRDVLDMTWDGEAVWMLSYGPKGLVSEDQVVSRFKLR